MKNLKKQYLKNNLATWAMLLVSYITYGLIISNAIWVIYYSGLNIKVVWLTLLFFMILSASNIMISTKKNRKLTAEIDKINFVNKSLSNRLDHIEDEFYQLERKINEQE